MTDKKGKQKRIDEEARFQRERAKQQEHKKKMMPLVMFLKKEGLRFEYARVGQNRIEYFRLDDFNKLKDNKGQKISKNEEISKLIEHIRNDLIYFKRPAEMKNLKYPKQLQPTTQSQAKFASFKFDTTVSRKGMMIGILIAVLAVVLFPVWPYLVKYGVWLISLYLLIFLVGLIVLRLIIYVICVVIGYNVWIFPNLLGQYGFIDSFKPLLYYEKWQSSMFNIIIRLSALIVLGYFGWVVYMNPQILSENVEITKETINDIHDWGVHKLVNKTQFSERAITNLEEILNETADVKEEGEEEL